MTTEQSAIDQALHRLVARTEESRALSWQAQAQLGARYGLSDWEAVFSPYDEQTYALVLDHVHDQDTVLEIGAGDLRLALLLASRARAVYAVEVNPLLVWMALETIGPALPHNLHVTCTDALNMDIPCGVTVAVLLMRHCQHLAGYFDRLEAAGCERLITNARWKSGVEVIDLQGSRRPFVEVHEGWYVCRCGAVGYVGEGSRAETLPWEVRDCPHCGNAS
ncbi:MAG: rRNA adenine methyltransferase [Chloroflexi bacterium]|nr:rRNA adenine methyltransferase [Chloroflexota bacterium]